MPQNITEYLDQLILAMTELKVAINESDDTEPVLRAQKLTDGGQPTVPIMQESPPEPPLPKSDAPTEVGTFEELYEILKTDRWPDAVNKHLICDQNDPDEKLSRGRGILDLMVGSDLKDKKFLDFGCGEGFSTISSSDKGAALSVGYDVKESPNWTNTKKGMIFTKDWEEVKANGPYDCILCFDVLDHSVVEEPAAVMQKLKEVLSPEGKIYMRTHPWTSRHANHFYHKVNKAYIHLVFSDEELKKIDNSWGNDPLFEENVGYTRPLMTYQNLIDEAGLATEHVREMKEEVEQFFSSPKIAGRIIAATELDNYPEFQMSLQFIDYVLTHK